MRPSARAASLLLAAVALAAVASCRGACGGAGHGAGPAPRRTAEGDPIVSLSEASAFEAETQIEPGPGGLVAVTWTAVPTKGVPFIGYAFSTDDGASFLPAAALRSPGGRLASDPVLVVDGAGRFHLVWVGFRTGGAVPFDAHVYVATAPAGRTELGPPVEVSDPNAQPSSYDKPWITVTPRGALLVTFERTGPDGYSLIAARSAGGDVWTRSVIARDPTSTNPRNLARPCAARPGSRTWVTYVGEEPSGRRAVGLGWSDDDGASWVDPARAPTVSLPGEPVELGDPSCAASGREVWIAYGLSADPHDDGARMAKLDRIRVAHSGDDGASIDLRVDAGDPKAGRFAMNPALVRDGSGALLLAFYAGDRDGDPAGTFRVATAPGPALTFAPSGVVHAPLVYLQSRLDQRGLGDYCGLAVRGGAFYASYVDNSSGASHVAVHRGELR